MPQLKGKKNYLEKELVVLCAVFSSNNFSMGDDDKDECKRIAQCFERTPGTIDMQWRNIKNYLAGKSTKKIGSAVKYWADRMLENPTLVKNLAIHYCEKENWGLKDLIDGGKGV